MSYSQDPSSSDKDYLRFKTGDVVDPEILSDAEYEFILTENENDKEISFIAAIEIMLPRVSSYINEKVGNVSIDYGEWYNRLLTWYENLLSNSVGSSSVYVGGQFVSEILTVDAINTGKSLFGQINTNE